MFIHITSGLRRTGAAAVIAGAAAAATAGLTSAPASAAPLGKIAPAATSATVSVDLGRLEYDGGTGNANRLVIRIESGQVTVADSAALTAGRGCRVVAVGKARCGSASLVALRAFLRDGNDSADIQIPTKSGAQVFGEAGDDYFRAGRSAGVIYLGGSGVDEVDYFGIAQGVTITLDNVANDGPGRGRDNVLEAERISGTSFADRITGSARSEDINGGSGNDVIDPAGGADVVFGSIGDDTLLLRDGIKDTANGGPGTDTATADLGLDVLSLIE